VKKILKIAHRGASALEPENTLRAVERSMELGADMIEVDVSAMSKDGHLIVIHDKTVDRTTNGRGYVFDMSLEELKGLDAGRGEKIPTLQEVIGAVRGRAKLLIDLKHPFSSVIERELVDVVQQERMNEDTVITSSEGTVLMRLKAINPKLKVALLVNGPVDDPEELALKFRADILHLGSPIWANMKVVRNAHSKRLSVFVGNPSSVKEIGQLIKLGVDGITTDDPTLFPKASKD